MARPVNPFKSLYISGAMGQDRKALKTLSLGELDALMEAKVEGTGDAWSLYKVVPWVYRCTLLRAQAVSAMPYTLTKHGTEGKQEETEWELKDHLPRLLWLTEAGLCLCGAAYWLKQYNRVALKNLKWLAASTMKWDADEVSGLKKFTRRLGSSAPIEWSGDMGGNKLQDIVYFWLPDPAVEIGPGTPPAMVAAVAAGLSRDALAFAAAFFARGAIPAVILSVEGNPKPEELEKLENWWKRLLGGVRRAWETVAVAATVKPIVVGAYPRDLAMPGLEGIVRQQVAAAMGVRPSMVEQSSNYATAKEDRLSFYQDTIIPECGFIEAELNRQLFKPMNMELRFTPETLDIMQEEEADRADALVKLTTAGVPLDMAMQMLGYELPEGYTYEEMRAPKAKPAGQVGQGEGESSGEGAASQAQKKPASEAEGPKPEQITPAVQPEATQVQAETSQVAPEGVTKANPPTLDEEEAADLAAIARQYSKAADVLVMALGVAPSGGNER